MELWADSGLGTTQTFLRQYAFLPLLPTVGGIPRMLSNMAHGCHPDSAALPGYNRVHDLGSHTNGPSIAEGVEGTPTVMAGTTPASCLRSAQIVVRLSLEGYQVGGTGAGSATRSLRPQQLLLLWKWHDQELDPGDETRTVHDPFRRCYLYHCVACPRPYPRQTN